MPGVGKSNTMDCHMSSPLRSGCYPMDMTFLSCRLRQRAPRRPPQPRHSRPSLLNSASNPKPASRPRRASRSNSSIIRLKGKEPHEEQEEVNHYLENHQEIGRWQISNPKSEVSNWTFVRCDLIFRI